MIVNASMKSAQKAQLKESIIQILNEMGPKTVPFLYDIDRLLYSTLPKLTYEDLLTLHGILFKVKSAQLGGIE